MHLNIHPMPNQAIVEFFGEDHAKEWFQRLRDGKEKAFNEALKRQEQLAVKNSKTEHRGVESIGQCMTRWDPVLYRLLTRAFSEEEVEGELQQRLQKDFGAVFFKPRYQTKARIIHPGMPKAQQDHIAGLARETQASVSQPSTLNSQPAIAA